MDTTGLDALQDQLNNMKKELNKSASFVTNKFSDFTKKFGVLKQKKTKINKMSATMYMIQDKSITVVFDDPNDSEKFFGK